MKMSIPRQDLCIEGSASPADDVQLLERGAAERRWTVMAARLAALLHDRPEAALCLQGGEGDCSAA